MADDPVFSLPGQHCYLLFSPLCVADPSFYVRCELDAWNATTPVANQRGSDLANKLGPLLIDRPHTINYPAYPQAPTVSVIAPQIRNDVVVIMHRASEICWAVNVQTGQVLPAADAPRWVGPIHASSDGGSLNQWFYFGRDDRPSHGFQLDKTERAAIEARVETYWEELVAERAGDTGVTFYPGPGRLYDFYYAPLATFRFLSVCV